MEGTCRVRIEGKEEEEAGWNYNHNYFITQLYHNNNNQTMTLAGLGWMTYNETKEKETHSATLAYLQS